MVPTVGETSPEQRTESAASISDIPAELEACEWYHATTHVINGYGEEWPTSVQPQLRIHLEYSVAHLLRVVVEAPGTIWCLNITDPIRAHVEFQVDEGDSNETDIDIPYLRWALDQVGVRLQRPQ